MEAVTNWITYLLIEYPFHALVVVTVLSAFVGKPKKRRYH